MDSSQWERIQTIFHDVVARPQPEQRAYLEIACGGDAAVMDAVLAMLEADRRSASLLDRGLPEIAYRMVGAPVEPEREFGPYRLQRILGEGGMGVVWLAEREDTGALVAIKFLPHAGLSPERLERFAREIRTLARLRHPYIARLYDAGTLAGGTPWFVMEYVDGVPFADHCRGQDNSVEPRLLLFRRVCEAVQYAHSQAVIHRDLKPSNILVDKDGTPRLLDFGIAREVDDAVAPTDRTRPGLRFLSPDYAAPEWVRDGTVAANIDVYSLGVILYEVLAGRLPAPAGNPEKPSVVARHADLSRAAWKDLDILCLKALHAEPQERYQSVEALLRDIDHYLRSEPLDARPYILRYRIGKFVKRNRRPVLTTAVVSLLVVGLVVFFTLRLAKARNAALAEAARTQRVERFMENLFQGGDKDAGPAEDLRVVTLLDRGLQEAQDLNGDPAVQAELYETLGTIYRKLGKFDRADSVLQAALQQWRSLGDSAPAGIAGGLVALALLRADQAQFAEAERLIRQALATYARHLPPGDPSIAKATSALGGVLEERGQYASAIEVLNRARVLQSTKGGPNADLADTLELLADAHFYLGHYPESESLNRQVLGMLEQLHGPRHPSLSEVVLDLGHIRIQLGNYPEAERDYRRALAINEAWYGKDHPQTARAEGYLSQALSWQGRYEESRSLLQHAKTATERAYGITHPRVALILNNLGMVALQLNRLDEAAADFTRMADIYRAAYGDHQFTAQALVNLASVYQRKEQYTRAEELYRNALQIYAHVLPPGHLNTAVAEIKLGRALVSQKRFREAEGHTLAGYDVLTKQANPSIDYLQGARADLTRIYNALAQPDKAARFQQELTANQPKAVSMSRP